MQHQAITLAQQLIRFPSVTPLEAGSFGLIGALLETWGFQVTHLPFGSVHNLFARRGTGAPHLCFVGHVDVVPAGDFAGWSVDPFAGVIQSGMLWGRGAADMKGAIACFLAAISAFLDASKKIEGSISVLLTSDEEGPAVDGVQRLIPWLQSQGHIPLFFLIGEPTGLGRVGKEIKIGRRGSLTGQLQCYGKQGHIAYPHLADNPIPRLLETAQALLQLPLDRGNAFFEPSRLELTSLDVGNSVTNLIPAHAEARFGIRFNTEQDPVLLAEHLYAICQAHAGEHMLHLTCHGNAFLTTHETSIQLVSGAIEQCLGSRPTLSTSGGTSDGRFLIQLAPVIECGLPEDTIHQVDERVALEDLEKLSRIYLKILHLST